MYFSGLWGLLAIWSLLTLAKPIRAILANLIYFASAWVTWSVDVSHILHILLMILIVTSIPFWVISRRPLPLAGSRPTYGVGAILATALTVLSFKSILELNLVIQLPGIALIFDSVRRFIPRSEYLLMSMDLSWADYARVFETYISSLAGSFVWGHTYSPGVVKLIFVFCWIFGFYLAARITSRRSRAQRIVNLLFTCGYCAIFGAFFAFVCRIAKPTILSTSFIEYASSIKHRLTAPAIGITLLPILLFWSNLCSFTRRRLTPMQVLTLFCLWQLFYAVKIYISDSVCLLCP